MMEIEKMSNVDPGTLIIEVAKNAEHITPELQNAIALFIKGWAVPLRVLTPGKVDV